MRYIFQVAGTLLTPCPNLHQTVIPAIGSYFGIYGRGRLQMHITYNRSVTTYSKRGDFTKLGIFDKLWNKIKFHMFYKSVSYI